MTCPLVVRSVLAHLQEAPGRRRKTDEIRASLWYEWAIPAAENLYDVYLDELRKEGLIE